MTESMMRNLVQFVSDLVDSVPMNTLDSTVNLKLIERRKEVIGQLMTLADEVRAALRDVEAQTSAVEKIQAIEVDAIHEFVSRLTSNEPPAEDWVTVVRKQAKLTTDGPVRIRFSNSLSLPATVVKSFDDVLCDGRLFYVQTADHFAFRLSGALFHGGIGQIYTDERTPQKIKDCAFARKCVKKAQCEYYHDPLVHPGSHDCRNFVANSWLYQPENHRQGGRSFGNRSSLDADIMRVAPDEAKRFSDQVMHDVLCSLLMRENKAVINGHQQT